MKNIIALVKINIINYIRSFSSNKKSSKKAVLIILLVYGLLFISMSGYALSIGSVLHSQGLDDVILVIGLLGGSILSLTMSISSSQSYIYSSSDTELLLSLPIKTKHVVLSKIISLYFTTFLFFITIYLPFGLFYAFNNSPNILFYVGLLVTLLIGNLIFICIGMIVGFLIGLIGNGLKNKGLFQTIVTVILLVTFMIIYFSFTNMVDVDIEDPDALYALTLQMVTLRDNAFRVFLPIKLLVNGLYLLNIDLLYGLLINIIPFILVTFFINLTYKKMLTIFNKSYRSKKKEIKQIKSASLTKALIKKEARTIFFNANVAVNTAMFPIISLVVLVSFSFMNDSSNAFILLIIFCLLFTSINPTGASLLSLEGKNFALVKSLPIDDKKVIKAKVLFSLFVSLPFALIDSIVIFLLTKTNIYSLLLSLAILPLSALFNSMLSVYINIRKPVFNWDNPLKVVKQGIATLLTMAFGVVYAIIVGIIGAVLIMLLPAYIAIGIIFVALIALNFLMFRIISCDGMRRFRLLEA